VTFLTVITLPSISGFCWQVIILLRYECQQTEHAFHSTLLWHTHNANCWQVITTIIATNTSQLVMISIKKLKLKLKHSSSVWDPEVKRDQHSDVAEVSASRSSLAMQNFTEDIPALHPVTVSVLQHHRCLTNTAIQMN